MNIEARHARRSTPFDVYAYARRRFAAPFDACRRCGAAVACLFLTTVLAAGCVTNQQLREDGYAALRSGDAPAAVEHFERAVERRPSDHKAQVGLGEAYLKLNQPLDAQLAFEKALAITHDDPQWTPRILDGIAEALYRQERTEALHAFLSQTASEYGDSEDYLRQAEYLVRIGDVDGAVVAFQKAAYFAGKGDAEPYIAMADFYEAINDQPQAIRSLRYAYWVDPDHPDIPDMFRRYGLVPGPTLQERPPKPELLD